MKIIFLRMYGYFENNEIQISLQSYKIQYPILLRI